MRKLIFPILIILVGTAFWSSARGDTIYSDDDTMRVEDAYGFPGDTVDVQIIMSNTMTIEAINHRFVYDETLLEVDTVYCVDRGCYPEVFGSFFPDSGVVEFIAYNLLDPEYIFAGIGPVVNVSFIVKESATPGEVTTIEFRNQENIFDNAWADTLGQNLIIPQLIPGTFSVLGGGINLPPVIGYVGSQSVAEGQLLQFGVTAHDPEGDPLTLSARDLPPNATFPTTQGDSLVTSTFSFTPDFSQGPDTFIVTFSVSDDHNNVTDLPVQIVVLDQPNDRIAISSDQGGIPGATNRAVDVMLQNAAPVYGTQLEILFDPSMLDVPQISPTQRCNNMWFNANEPEPGRLVVLIFSVGLDYISAGNGPITQIMMDVNSDTTFGPTDITFLSAIEVIDSIGTAKDLDSEDGFFTVDRYGDGNLDGIVNVGDCLSIVAYIIGVQTYTLRQVEAADFNSNGFVDIGDLQDIINFILEIISSPQGSPEGPPVQVELLAGSYPAGDLISVPIHIDLPVAASAVQFEIQYNSENLSYVDIVPGDMTSDMALDYNVTEEGINCVIYNLGGGSFGPAAGDLAELQFELAGPNYNASSDISISDFVIVNPSADFMPVEIVGQLPEDFVLNQNYPNPFNATTSISFNLQEPGQVKLQVYDLLGRSVVTLQDGFLQAGSHSVTWDGRSTEGLSLASGVYFYRLRAGDFDKTKKMLLIK